MEPHRPRPPHPKFSLSAVGQAPGLLCRSGSEFKHSTCFLNPETGRALPQHASPCRKRFESLVCRHTTEPILQLDLPAAIARFGTQLCEHDRVAARSQRWPQLGAVCSGGPIVQVCLERLELLLQMESDNSLPQAVTQAASYTADSYIPLLLLLSSPGSISDTDPRLRNCLPSLWSAVLEDDIPMNYRATMDVSLSGDPASAEHSQFATRFIMSSLPQKHTSLRRDQLLDEAAANPSANSASSVFLYWVALAFHLGLYTGTCTCRPHFLTRMEIYHTLICQPRQNILPVINWMRVNPTATTLAAREIYIHHMNVLGFDQGLTVAVRWTSFLKSTSNFANVMRKLMVRALAPEPKSPMLEDRLNFSSQSYSGTISMINREIQLDLKWLPSPRGAVYSTQAGTGIPIIDFRSAHFSTCAALIWQAVCVVPRPQYMEPEFLLHLNIPDLDHAEVHRFCEAMRMCVFKGIHRAIRNAFRKCSFNSPKTAALLYLFVSYRDIVTNVCLVKYTQPLEMPDGSRQTLWDRQCSAIMKSRYIAREEDIPPHLYTLYGCTQCRSIKHDLGAEGEKLTNAKRKTPRKNTQQTNGAGRHRNQKFSQGVENSLLINFTTRTCESKIGRRHQPKNGAQHTMQELKTSTLHQYVSTLCSQTPLAQFDLRSSVLYWFNTPIGLCCTCGVFTVLSSEGLRDADFQCKACRMAGTSSASIPRGFCACRICANTVTLHHDARTDQFKPRHELAISERGAVHDMPVCTQCHTKLRRHSNLTIEKATAIESPPSAAHYGQQEKTLQSIILQLLMHCE